MKKISASKTPPIPLKGVLTYDEIWVLEPGACIGMYTPPQCFVDVNLEFSMA